MVDHLLKYFIQCLLAKFAKIRSITIDTNTLKKQRKPKCTPSNKIPIKNLPRAGCSSLDYDVLAVYLEKHCNFQVKCLLASLGWNVDAARMSSDADAGRSQHRAIRERTPITEKWRAIRRAPAVFHSSNIHPDDLNLQRVGERHAARKGGQTKKKKKGKKKTEFRKQNRDEYSILCILDNCLVCPPSAL